MKKLNQCTDGGYRKLQQSLLQDKGAHCKACCHLLEARGFNPEALKSEVDAWLNGGPPAVRSREKAEKNESRVDEETKEEVEDGKCLNKKRRAAADEEKACLAFLRTHEPTITILPAGSYSKRLPYRCNLCVSSKWPHGRIGEASEMRLASLENFIGNHLRSETHRKNVRRSQLVVDAPPRQQVMCQAMNISDEETAGSLHVYQKEFSVWASFANFADHGKHSYIRDATSNTWTIRSFDCLRHLEVDADQEQNERRHVCAECLKLGGRNAIVKTVLRFQLKYFAAQLLSARLFGGMDAVDSLVADMKESAYYQRAPLKIDQVLHMSSSKLQLYVRAGLKCDPNPSDALKSFIASVVTPACDVNIASIPDRLAETVSKLSCMLKGAEGSEQDKVDIKLALSAVSGRLQNHPLIQGLILQCSRYLEKRSRGIKDMRGRRSNESDLERDLVLDAGLQLSIASNNKNLATQFGLAMDSGKVRFDVLARHSLPIPCLALDYPEQLAENFNLADQRFKRANLAPKCTLYKIHVPRLLSYKNELVIFDIVSIRDCYKSPFAKKKSTKVQLAATETAEADSCVHSTRRMSPRLSRKWNCMDGGAW